MRFKVYLIRINMTLANLVDDILLEARNSSIAESEHLSRHQIELWIKSYRALLIKQQVNKDKTIDPIFTQTIQMHLSKMWEKGEPGHVEYRTDEKLPKLIDFNWRPGIISVKDRFGHLIQIGSETKMKFQKYRKYTCARYIAYVKDDYLYVEGDSNLLEFIEVELIAEDPTEAIECYDPYEDEYPIPADMWATIKQFIMDRDIPALIRAISDDTNDTDDNTLNRIQQRR